MYDELVQIIIHDRFTFANKFAQMRITQRWTKVINNFHSFLYLYPYIFKILLIIILELLIVW